MSKYTVEVLPVSKTVIGEGPHWDEKSQQLYYVDIIGKAVHRYDPATGQEHKVYIDDNGEVGYVSFVVPAESDSSKFVIGYGRAISVMSWDGTTTKMSPSQLKTLHQLEATAHPNRFNDAKCDSRGRLWAGSMGIDWQKVKGMGALYRLDASGALSHHVSKIDLSNGLGWSPDNKVFYYIDSMAYSVDGFDYDVETGNISNRRVVFDFKANKVDGIPDGMCVDSDGNLWVAVFDASKVIHVNPTTGKLIGSVDLPSPKITSCAFGGPDLDILYVTSANYGMKPEEIATTGAGSLYKVTNTGAKGLSAGVAYAGVVKLSISSIGPSI